MNDWLMINLCAKCADMMELVYASLLCDHVNFLDEKSGDVLINSLSS